MARYIVQVVIPDGRTIRLLIVLSPDQLCSALLDKVKSRILGLNLGDLISEIEHITLRLDSANGPILDTEDLLSDILPEAKEEVYAIVGALSDTVASNSQATSGAPNNASSQAVAGKSTSLRIRVITPELARSLPDVNAIPPLPETSATFKTTLKELESRVKQHLHFDDASVPSNYQDLRCNCSFARQIDSGATLNELTTGEAEALRTLIVVCGNNKVACLPIREPTRTCLEQAVQQQLPTEIVGKTLSFIGGLRNLQSQVDGNYRYLKLPTVALCVPQRHDGSLNKTTPDASSHRTVLDMHTSEMPIHITAHNSDTTLAAAGLVDCMVNGVLNIYAVKRSVFNDARHSYSGSQGKDAIYRQSGAWMHPLGQSQRGLANFLSSLRMFASLTHAKQMEESEQDAVLHVLMLLTKFPPAVRAVHILMRGETPQPSERATIVQCIYEVLKTVVPLRVIGSDPQRLLEGSRLLFGLVLEKAKHLKVSMNNGDGNLPYMGAMKVHELRNPFTMEPVVAPMQTVSGLVDTSFFEAFDRDGPLRWTSEKNMSKVAIFDRKTDRACLVSGGVKSHVVSFDIDAINSSHRYADGGDAAKVIGAAEYSDLQYLASLCSRNKLGVLHPSALPSADPPVLTLDRVGQLALYVGRQGCGQAGRDINMFRPASSVVEEAVDVSIITQLLVPILERRTADGTAVFEAFGDQNRQIKDPDEVVILCVDASASMDDRCGFIDVEQNEDAAATDTEDDFSDIASGNTSDDVTEPDTEDLQFDRPALDELKEYLSSHESFEDFLAITQSGTDDYHRHKNAEKVLTILRNLAREHMKAKSKALGNVRRRGTNYHYRQQASIFEKDLATLKNREIRLQQYNDALVAFLLYRAENRVLDELLTWKDGEGIPQVPKKSTLPPHDMPKFEMPAEYLCPISAELMDDPVTTTDGFTYERKNIERWFQTHETSPCTNLVLESFDLRPNYTLKQSIVSWINGSDITSVYTSTPGYYSATLQSPLNAVTIVLPHDITVEDLYQKVFRVTKGRYGMFELHSRNILLTPSSEIARPYVNSSDTIIISPVEPRARLITGGDHEDLCLVKVYGYSYEKTILSYWEPKMTTKTLSSVIFRYYRHAFSENPWQSVSGMFTIWTDMTYTGDSHYSGYTQHHWQLLSQFFTYEHATGRLISEPVYSKEDNREQYMGPPSSSSSAGSQPLVFRVQLSGSPRSPNRKALTRLGVLKQMFDGYINRLLAYGYQTHLGLVTFKSTPSLTQEVTHAIENFRHQLNNIKASGDTALFDAIMLARDTLVEYATKYPKAKLRIICLSDGLDTKSEQRVQDVALGLIRDRIVVDSFCLGDVDNLELQALSYLTGGYKFQPDQMEHAMAICEMEPVLSGLERPDVVLPSLAKRLNSNPALQFERAMDKVEIDEVTRDSFPTRKEHPLLSEAYIELGRFNLAFNMANRSDGNLRLSRIHNEIRNCGAKGHPYYDIYICESNFSMWKIVMQGPPGSTYANGTFLLYLEMGEDYPAFPPKGRFVTPIYHPNINRHGRICHSIFDRNWTVDTTNKDVIDTVYSLLLVPEFSDPINTVVTLNFHWDEVQFKEEAQRHIQKHASKNRSQWKEEILAG